MTPSQATTHGFLFADLRDYTRFVEIHGDAAAAELLTAYRSLMRDVIQRMGGAEIKTEGDSFYVVFPSASSAIEGGLAILSAANEATARDPARPIRVGIGVHAGETHELTEGPVGLAVNIAARVCARAKPGELLVTDTVRALTRTRLSVQFVPRGSPKLKGIAEPMALYAVAAAAQPRPTPPRRMRGVAIAVGLVALAALSAGAIVLLDRPGHTPSSAAAGLPCAAASGAPPPIADVSAYRADVTRSSVYPGPGPQCQPQVVWQRQLGAVANFVPLVVSSQVIVGDQSGLHAFDATTGEPRWTFAGSGGFVESAFADRGIIFAADLGGTLHAIDASSGTERWKVPLPNNGIRPTIAAGLVWVGSSDGHAYGLDPSTGAERWRWEGPAGKPASVDLVDQDAAYVVSGGTLFAIRLVDRSELWHLDTGANAVTGPVMAGNTIYIAARPDEGGGTNGALFAVDKKSGKNRWRPFAIASGHQITPGPTQDGVLYVTTDGDGVYALRDDGSEYQIVWHKADVSVSWRPASLVGDLLYIQQNESTLLALRADTGQLIWNTPNAMHGDEAPVVTGGFVFQVDDEANVVRAWAEPPLAAKLGVAASPSATASASQVANPFTITATFPWFETGIQVPAAIAVGPDGLLYVLHAKGDYSNPKVTILDPKTGHAVTSWGRYGSGPGELDLTGSDGNAPGGCIQVSPDGLVYVGERANRRVEVFRRNGTLVRQIGAGQLGLVLSCTLASDGSLYTNDDNTSMLTKFSPSGKLLWRRLADPQHPLLAFQIHGMTIRADGKIIGFTDGTGQALVLDPADGRVIQRWGQPGSSPGELGGSGEPTLDRHGNIFVFQYVPEAIQVFDPTGHLLGALFEESNTASGYQFEGTVFWPPPVFGKDGSAYSFGPDGLIELKVSLPTK